MCPTPPVVSRFCVLWSQRGVVCFCWRGCAAVVVAAYWSGDTWCERERGERRLGEPRNTHQTAGSYFGARTSRISNLSVMSPATSNTSALYAVLDSAFTHSLHCTAPMAVSNQTISCMSAHLLRGARCTLPRPVTRGPCVRRLPRTQPIDAGCLGGCVRRCAGLVDRCSCAFTRSSCALTPPPKARRAAVSAAIRGTLDVPAARTQAN